MWHHNKYPGCVCDVPSVLYSFGFRPNPEWSRFFAPQVEIRQYLMDMASESGVTARARVGTEMLSASWDGECSRWVVNTTKGNLRARMLILAVGSLHATRFPEIEGLDSFKARSSTAPVGPKNTITQNGVSPSSEPEPPLYRRSPSWPRRRVA